MIVYEKNHPVPCLLIVACKVTAVIIDHQNGFWTDDSTCLLRSFCINSLSVNSSNRCNKWSWLASSWRLLSKLSTDSYCKNSSFLQTHSRILHVLQSAARPTTSQSFVLSETGQTAELWGAWSKSHFLRETKPRAAPASLDLLWTSAAVQTWTQQQTERWTVCRTIQPADVLANIIKQILLLLLLLLNITINAGSELLWPTAAHPDPELSKLSVNL